MASARSGWPHSSGAPASSCRNGGQPAIILAHTAKKQRGNGSGAPGALTCADSPLLRYFIRRSTTGHAETGARLPAPAAEIPPAADSADRARRALAVERTLPSSPRRRRAVSESAPRLAKSGDGWRRGESPGLGTTWRVGSQEPASTTLLVSDSPPTTVAESGSPGTSVVPPCHNRPVEDIIAGSPYSDFPAAAHVFLKGPAHHSFLKGTDAPCDTETTASDRSSKIAQHNDLVISVDMPPKAQRPPPGPKRAPTTPASKSSNWSALVPDDDGSAPSLSNQMAGGTAWSSSSESLAGEAVVEERGDAPTSNWRSYLSHLPTKEDFKTLLAEVKDTCRTEIASIRQDLTAIADRVDALETAHDSTRSYVAELQTHSSVQATALKETRRHLEDLDNRGRRNNIRIRGLPEAEGREDLQLILESIFNKLRDVPLTTPIKLDRVHRALRPKSASTQPRDVICCVHDYMVKEAIMAKARTLRHVDFEGSQIQLYPDLSWLTLQKRRCLKPLLAVLKEHELPYRWGFPFALLVAKNGRTVTLRSYEDLPSFCATLHVPVPDMADWEVGTPPLAPPPEWQKAKGRKKQKGSSLVSSPQAAPSRRPEAAT